MLKPNRRWYKTFIGETLDYQESDQIDPQVLAEMVARLRVGDSSMIEPIIKGHLKLIVGIVSDNARGSRHADIEGAALLALVEAVNDCCPHFNGDDFCDSRLYDNNITYYITTTVKYAIKEEYSNAYVMRMPPRTIRDKVSKGAVYADIIPGEGMMVRSDRLDAGNVHSADGDHQSFGADRDFIMPYHIPLAKMEFIPIEFSEILAKATEGLQQQEIVRLRMEGHSYKEVGQIVGLTTGRVGQIVPEIEARFDKLNR